jgi:hypothetical protein
VEAAANNHVLDRVHVLPGHHIHLDHCTLLVATAGTDRLHYGTAVQAMGRNDRILRNLALGRIRRRSHQGHRTVDGSEVGQPGFRSSRVARSSDSLPSLLKRVK